MGHEGMAVAAVRYLRSTGAAGSAAAVETGEQYRAEELPGPRAALRSVRPDERAPGTVTDSRAFRSVLGHFCTGVTVVGALTEQGRPVGFACQSFSSLSLDPPLISFNVARTSASWPQIARAGSFSVSVLAADQGELCRTFAVSGATGADKFAGLDWSPAPGTGAPRLAGALAWIDCTIHAVHTGGDHLIVIGRVCGLAPGADESGPLLFYRGGFGTLDR